MDRAPVSSRIVSNLMTVVADICEFLDAIAPPETAEDWDNVGLLVGRRSDPVSTVCTCLTLTPDVADEAVAAGVQLVVSHHPLMFRPVQRVTADTVEGSTLLTLIQAGIAVYSAHTRFDSAGEGINQRLAAAFGLQNIAPLLPLEQQPQLGSGRFGQLPERVPLSDFLTVVRSAVGADYLEYVGQPDARTQRVAVACGAAAGFLADAIALGCDTFVTGEARFHDALEARSRGINLILTGHYRSERPAMEQLAAELSRAFADVSAFASQAESDPLRLFASESLSENLRCP